MKLLSQRARAALEELRRSLAEAEARRAVAERCHACLEECRQVGGGRIGGPGEGRSYVGNIDILCFFKAE